MIKQLPPNCNARIAKAIEIKLVIDKKNTDFSNSVSKVQSRKQSPQNEEPFFQRSKNGEKAQGLKSQRLLRRVPIKLSGSKPDQNWYKAVGSKPQNESELPFLKRAQIHLQTQPK